jgi:hypothetical protein
MNRGSASVPLAFPLLLASCGGSVDLGANRSQGAPDASSEAASTDSGAPLYVGNATGPELFTWQGLEAAMAHCSGPDAPELNANPPTIGGFRALLAGAWARCDPNGIGLYAMVFTTKRTGDPTVELYDWYQLLADAKGNLVRGLGVAQTGTWAIDAKVLFMPPDAGDSTALQPQNTVDCYPEDGSDISLGQTLVEMNTPLRMITESDPTIVWVRLGDMPQ